MTESHLRKTLKDNEREAARFEWEAAVAFGFQPADPHQRRLRAAVFGHCREKAEQHRRHADVCRALLVPGSGRWKG